MVELAGRHAVTCLPARSSSGRQPVYCLLSTAVCRVDSRHFTPQLRRRLGSVRRVHDADVENASCLWSMLGGVRKRTLSKTTRSQIKLNTKDKPFKGHLFQFIIISHSPPRKIHTLTTRRQAIDPFRRMAQDQSVHTTRPKAASRRKLKFSPGTNPP